mmetsp:Transcript_7980/g.21898  ORF Transcript_7980/g.21898 Transcript_7980/m.21898 type:complete len:306 (+) Transcript_7980:36-953(+)
MLRLAQRCRGGGHAVALRVRARPLCSAPPPPQPPSAPSSTEVVVRSGGIGLCAGIFGALAGLGGGVVMVPMLTGFAGLSQHAAHGTSLVAVVSTGIGGCASYASHGQVDWSAACAIAASASLSAIAGARATSALSGATLKRLMGFFMMAVAPLVPLKEYIVAARPAVADGGAAGGETPGSGASGLSTSQLAQCGAMGIVSGALSGMFGVGGGSIVTPMLAFVTDLPHQAVLGTTLASMVIPSALGAHAHWRMGNVAAAALPGLLAGTALGAYVGAQLAMSVPQEALRWFFCASFVVLGAKSAFKL